MKKILAALLFFVSACGLDNADVERQEVLDRLRGLGVEVVPLVSEIPTATETPAPVTLVLHAAVPGDAPYTVEPFRNLGRVGANVVLPESDIAIDTPNIKELKIGNLRVLTITAISHIPNELAWRGARGGTLQYGFKIKSGDRTEYVSGEFLAYKKGSPELDWKSPVIDLKFPLDGAVIAKDTEEEVSVGIVGSQEELLFPGWFVSSGIINSRRSETTTWKPTVSGEQALIVTVRGINSFGFAIKVVKVNVQ